MNITKHSNLISVCMTEDGFPKQNSDCTAQHFPQGGVQFHTNAKMRCKNTALLSSYAP